MLSKVLVRNQNEDYKLVEVENIDLDFLQHSVGGYIERINFIPELNRRRIDMWINEEGKLIEGLTPTFVIVQEESGEVLDFVFGDVLFASNDDDGNTIGLDDMQIQYIKSKLKRVAVLSDGSIATVIAV